MSDMDDTRSRVREIAATAGVTSYEDMDSLDTLDVCLAVEKEFGVQIPDDRLESLTSEDSLVELLDELRAKV
jgi:acyl carrier protein